MTSLRFGDTTPIPLLTYSRIHVFILLVDFFQFFRYALGTVVTIYATVVTLQSLWGWYIWLAGSDKYISLVRRYVLLHGLRLRILAFWGDVLICLLLCVAFLLMWRLHGLAEAGML